MAREVMFIVARARNGCIAKDGRVPWAISEDLRRFRRLTMGPGRAGLPMVMGRKTFESLPGVLPGRRHIVLTRQPDWGAPGAEVAHDREKALALVGEKDFAVIGGAEIFALFEACATRFELTHVHEDTAGEVFMPSPANDSGWRETGREHHAARNGDPAYDFVTYQRTAD